jgi:mRNA-degrading endonuclease toxin of MazEF toxin-antitoxin module
MKRGDIVRVELPAPAGPSGREQFGVRPAIVVQRFPSASNTGGTVLVVPLTSTLSARRFQGSVWKSRLQKLMALICHRLLW